MFFAALIFSLNAFTAEVCNNPCTTLGHVTLTPKGVAQITEVSLAGEISAIEEDTKRSRDLRAPIKAWAPTDAKACSTDKLKAGLEMDTTNVDQVSAILRSRSAMDAKIDQFQESVNCFPFPVFRKDQTGKLSHKQNDFVSTKGTLNNTHVNSIDLSFETHPQCKGLDCSLKIRVDNLSVDSELSVTDLQDRKLISGRKFNVKTSKPVFLDLQLRLQPNGEIEKIVIPKESTQILLDPLALSVQLGNQPSSEQMQVACRTAMKGQSVSYDDAFIAVMHAYANDNPRYRALLTQAHSLKGKQRSDKVKEAVDVHNSIMANIGSSRDLSRLQQRAQNFSACTQGGQCQFDCKNNLNVLRGVSRIDDRLLAERAKLAAANNSVSAENGAAMVVTNDLINSAIKSDLVSDIVRKEVERKKVLLMDKVKEVVTRIPQYLDRVVLLPTLNSDQDDVRLRNALFRQQKDLQYCVDFAETEEAKLNCQSSLKRVNKKIAEIQAKIDETFIDLDLRYTMDLANSKMSTIRGHVFNFDGSCQKPAQFDKGLGITDPEVSMRTEFTLDGLNLYFQKLYTKFKQCTDEKDTSPDCKESYKVTFDSPPTVKLVKDANGQPEYLVTGIPQVDKLGGVKTQIRFKPEAFDGALRLKSVDVNANSDSIVLLIGDAGTIVEDTVKKIATPYSDKATAYDGEKNNLLPIPHASIHRQPMINPQNGDLIIDWQINIGKVREASKARGKK